MKLVWGRFPVMTGVRHWTLTVMDTTDVSSFLYLTCTSLKGGPQIYIYIFFHFFSKINFLLKNN